VLRIGGRSTYRREILPRRHACPRAVYEKANTYDQAGEKTDEDDQKAVWTALVGGQSCVVEYLKCGGVTNRIDLRSLVALRQHHINGLFKLLIEEVLSQFKL